MAITPPPTLDPAPSKPQRNDRDNFSGAVDTFVTWLIALVAKANAIAANIYNNALEAMGYATAAGSSAAAAAAAAQAANTAAESAAVTTGATLWVSGQTVAQDAAKISPFDRRTYRRKTASGAGTTDPSLDTTNYVLLSADANVLMPIGTPITISSPVSSINLLSSFAAIYDHYVVEVEGLELSSTNHVYVRFAQAGAVVSSAVYAAGTPGGGVFNFNTPNTEIQATGVGISGVTMSLKVHNTNETGAATRPRSIEISGIGYTPTGSNTSGPGYFPMLVGGVMHKTGDVSGIQLYTPATFTAGTIRIYGIRN